MHRPRPRTIAAGTLILLLAAAPFIPRGEDDHGSITPSSQQPRFQPRESAAAGITPISAQMRSEIARVAAATASVPQLHGRIDPRTAAAMAQCADLDGQRYCLGVGFTEESPTAIRARVVADAAPAHRTKHRKARVNTGDLSARGQAQRLAAMTPAQRATAARRELTAAAHSVAKVWLLRHEVQGVPLPDGFLAAHPEARVSTPSVAPRTAVTTAAAKSASASSTPSATVKTTTVARTSTASPSASPSASASSTAVPTIAASVPVTYPAKARIMKRKQTAEQIRTYWCGPTSMQMITWGWKQKDLGAAHWAKRLHTTSGGTAITDMVRVVNRSTGWDRSDHAGTYVVLDVRGWSTSQFYTLMQKHIAQYRAPVILHPLLSTRYFPYLPYSGSGHYQVGRGYRTTKDGVQEIGYFEPWNPQRFHPYVPYVSRVQWLPVSNVLAANKANSLHNIGL